MERFQQNPILSPADIPPALEGMTVESLLNPGAFRFDGKTWLLMRVAERPEQKPGRISFPVQRDGKVEIMDIDVSDPELDARDPRVISYKGSDYLTTMSHLRLVCSEDGIHFYEPGEGYGPIFGSGEYEGYGIEDCRVAVIDGLFYLTYTAVSRNGVAVGMMSTADWKSFRRYGLVLPPHNKDCALFEERIGGKYFMLHRPSSPEIGGNYIWLAESEDMQHWGNHRCILHTRPGHWDEARVGAGASPVLTDKGWLEIYHGADRNHRYALGAFLMDKDDPSKVLARSSEPLMVPETPYETGGFFGNVVFTNGYIKDGDRITVYYGAADSVICGAAFSVNEILAGLE